jgi:hypothetical protein
MKAASGAGVTTNSYQVSITVYFTPGTVTPPWLT